VTVRRELLAAPGALLVGLAGCNRAQSAPLYEKIAVVRRDVVVTATAEAVIQPILKFSVKSKAWGQILALPVQTGDEVQKGQLLARIDPRIPQNNLAQAQAALDKAQAQLANATAQRKRSEALYYSQAIAETDYDAAKLAYATARSAVVTAGATLQTAKDAMEDTQVRAPITGTILELDAVLGTVISSPTLGGGTVILKMANLDVVHDSAMVLETDIGRVQPGMAATITVDAYPNRQFQGHIRKIEPQARVVQNVTMFPVLIEVENPGHLLKPGMNTEVRIHIGERQGVLVVPYAALRTQRDVAAGASVLGLDPQAVQQQLAAAEPPEAPPRPGGDTATAAHRTSFRAADSTKAATFTTPLLPQVFGRAQRPGRLGRPARNGTGGGSGYIVFVLRGATILPVSIRTGLTDQDHIEVTSGLTDQDTVLVLPSASLVQSQQQFRQRFQNVTGGGLPGLRQQQSQGTATR
jgi:HlyD family secretion protein